jgi:hypothetical protein
MNMTKANLPTRSVRQMIRLCAASMAIALGVTAGLASGASAAGAMSSSGQAIVNAAASQAGVPYCFDGGTTSGPSHGSGGSGCGGSTKGFDCSGLALFAVFKGTGIVLPHNAAREATFGGTVITNPANLLPGDLVFFGGGSLAKAEHVGIYAGNGEMWDANDFNIPVQERSLSWEEHGLAFDGGVRYFNANTTPATTASPSPQPAPGGSANATTHAETVGSVTNTWTNYSDAGGLEGSRISKAQTVQVTCRVQGFTVPDGDDWWYQIASSPWSNAYYASADAFYNNGRTSGSLSGTPFLDPAVPVCGSSSPTPAPSPAPTPAPATTYAETVGGPTNTWTNYSNAGGTQGPTIASNQTVQIACTVQGFKVADGNTSWYRIASSPWNSAYYASADAFYNNGATSGGLSGTPFVDPKVPAC